MQNLKKYYLSISTVLIMIMSAMTYMYVIGRNVICKCGYIKLWAGDIWSSDNSQQIFDPYSLHHILHGLVFYFIITKLLKNVNFYWQLVIAVGIETAWELFENSNFIINRYREGTLAVGYNGDTIINSASDIVMCIVGFFLAKKIGVKYSLIFFIIVELISIYFIRDSLILNVIMLIYPIASIKNWQMALPH